MAGKVEDLSGYRTVWLFTMFDLPVDSKRARRQYTRFRKALIRLGFSKLQFSIYARFFASEESSRTCRKNLKAMIPPRGHVRFLTVTDRQFGKMEVYLGDSEVEPEEPPEQVMLF